MAGAAFFCYVGNVAGRKRDLVCSETAVVRVRFNICMVGCVLAAQAGCQREAEPRFTLSERTQELPEPLQKQISDILERYSGTPSDPRLIGNAKISVERLLHGAAVYQRRCESCHGTSGDARGPAAKFLDPRPRDYRRGIFKFTSTPYGAKPRREDLERTLRNGIVGTSMPSFELLPNDDLQAVIDYVLVLTHRGELEEQLVVEAETEDQIDPQLVPELVELVLERWEQATSDVVTPVTPQPPITKDTIASGREAFLNEQQGCFKCHGPNGRGGSVGGVEVGADVWGFKTAAADLTSGMLHGGQRPLDVYRRIYAGISGTPMPAFDNVYADQPDTIWHLVHYVFYVANKRREGDFFVTEQSQGEGGPSGETPQATGGD